MATITLRGNPTRTNGELPAEGAQAPDFTLTDVNLQDVKLSDFRGKKKLLNIVPSLDTGICAKSTKLFNDAAKKYPDAVLISVSADLPFAQKRFCQAEGVENIKTLSMFRNPNFARDYGVMIEDGPMAGLSARAVVVIDENDRVIYRELVPEIGQEPDYEKALAALG